MEEVGEVDQAQRCVAEALGSVGHGATEPGLNAEQRLAQLRGWLQLAARLDSVILDAVDEANRNGDAESVTGTSMRTWLAQTNHLSVRDAGRLVSRAERHQQCERIADEQSRGVISAAQAAAATEAVVSLPASLSTRERERAEMSMVDFTREFGPVELRRLGRHLLDAVAPEIIEAEEAASVEREHREAVKNRSFGWANDGHGTVHFRGRLPEVEAQSLIALVDATAHRAHRRADHLRGADCEQDRPPSFAQRRADALLDLVAHIHACAAAPAHGGDRPRLLVLLNEESLYQRVQAIHTGNAPRGVDSGPTGRDPAELEGRDRRPQFVGRAPNPGHGGARLADDGSRIPVGELRAIACDAEVVPVVLGGAGQVLDVGRAQRLVTPAIRTALTVRDRGCIMPGCDQPQQHCEAHHVIPWQLGGRTALDNLVLLCRSHHRVLEPQSNAPPGSRWEVRINPDGLPEVIPPKQVDPWRRARLHPRHRLPLAG